MSEREYRGGLISERPIELTVLDANGLTRSCAAVPQRIWFGRTDRFKEDQWLLESFNLELQKLQTFPLTSVRFDHTDLRVPHGPGDFGTSR